MEKNRNITGAIIGIILILIGVFAFFGQNFAFWNMDYLWPLFVIGVGAAFLIAMLVGDKSLGGLAIPGSILITIGLILFVMNLTNTWEAWSYCWALIVFAVGAGIWINGFRNNLPELRQRGFSTMRTGLVLFMVFGVLMEFIFSLSGEAHLGSLLLWSILLTVVGVYLLATRILKTAQPGGERVDLFWPILLIGAGLVGIFAEQNWFTVDNLGRMVNLWPVLLIVGGLALIFRHRSPWVGAVLGIVLIAGVFVIGFAGVQLGLPATVDWFSNIGTIQIGNVNFETIAGSGNLVTESRQVSGVTRVDMTTSAYLEIQQGTQESLTVTADDNILPYLQTNVSGGRMTIRYQPQISIRTIHQPKLVLTVKNLDELRLTSSGTVNVGPLTTGDFNIDITSSCNLTIQSIQADKITSNITSSGDVNIQGTANSLVVRISSSGNFVGPDLQVQDANVTLTSSGDVTVWVINNLSANLSSSGNVSYYGAPNVNQHTSSSGRVISKGEK
jgi:hypothetical protein